jgi:hypothetical protein
LTKHSSSISNTLLPVSQHLQSRSTQSGEVKLHTFNSGNGDNKCLASSCDWFTVVRWGCWYPLDWRVGLILDWRMGLIVDWRVGLILDWRVGLIVDWRVGHILVWKVGLIVDWRVGHCGLEGGTYYGLDGGTFFGLEGGIYFGLGDEEKNCFLSEN